MNKVLRRWTEAGRRNNARDAAKIQDIHDATQTLGANCVMGESRTYETVVRDGVEAKCVEAGMSFNQITELIQDAIEAQYPGQNISIWIRDVYPDVVIYSVYPNTDSDALYRRPYTLANGVVTLTGEPVEVEAVTTYVPEVEAANGSLGESAELTSDLVPLTEAKAIGKDGTARVKIISPGQGSSGYYPAATLEAAASKFADVQSFWDHPGASEDADRPERSLRDLAGKIVGVPTWEANGSTGPGIYADVQVFKPYQSAVEELAPHIGMSIRATGRAGTAVVDGKKVRSIESIDSVRSVDFVTVPGRGGEILQLFESARGGAKPPKGEDMNLEEALARIAVLEAAKPDVLAVQRLTEANQRIETLERDKARLQEQGIIRDATQMIEASLPSYPTLHKMAQERVTKELMKDFPAKDGRLDVDLFAARIVESATAEVTYLNEAGINAGGRGVRGMGGGALPDDDVFKEMTALFVEAGHPKEIAERMAAGK